MADIQRWHMIYEDAIPERLGKWVTYADHLAAVAAATENAVRDYAEAHYANGVKRYGDGVKAAREAVVAYHKGSCRRYYYENRCTCGLDAAIDALEKP